VSKGLLNIPVSENFQGMRTDFAYEKVYIIEDALRMLNKKGKFKSEEKSKK